MQKINFYLQKWYFDSVDEEGDLVIAYIAHISWRKIKLSFSSLLMKLSSDKLVVRNSLKKQQLPNYNPQTLSFKNSLYSIELQSQAPVISEKLFENENGCIEWNCYYPSSNISVDCCDKRIQGTGYAEELRMTIKPWELKIKELWWGRYVSEKENVVWIRWKGEWNKFFIWHNGKKITEGEINESEVTFENLELKFDDPEILRSGSVITTAFKRSLLFRILFPFRVLQSEETKWKSKGNLYLKNKIISQGNCIYEKVIWHE